MLLQRWILRPNYLAPYKGLQGATTHTAATARNTGANPFSFQQVHMSSNKVINTLDTLLYKVTVSLRSSLTSNSSFLCTNMMSVWKNLNLLSTSFTTRGHGSSHLNGLHEVSCLLNFWRLFEWKRICTRFDYSSRNTNSSSFKEKAKVQRA